MRRLPTLVQGLIIIACGIALAFGGCMGYLYSSDAGEELLATIGMVAFFGGVLGAIVGVGFFIVGVVKALVGKQKDSGS